MPHRPISTRDSGGATLVEHGILMKRPLVPVALCYAAGLLLAAAFQPPLVLLFAVAFALLAAAGGVSQARPWMLVAVLVVAGWTNLVTRTAVVSPHDLREILGDSAAYVTVRGTLQETPNLRIFVRDEQESFRTIVQLHVTALNRGTNWQPAAGHIVVTTIGELPGHFFAGQNVEITGVLARPPLPLARELFDYRTHLARQGIYYQLRADSTNTWRVDSN